MSIDVRFGALCGLKSDIASSPKTAINRHRVIAGFAEDERYRVEAPRLAYPCWSIPRLG
jgi:hypothetical protein